jgi:hypothetical protein
MEAVGYAIAALILVGGALVSVAQLIGAWRRGQCALLWNTIVVRRAEQPVRFHLVMTVWTLVCLGLAALLVVAACLLARVALG